MTNPFLAALLNVLPSSTLLKRLFRSGLALLAGFAFSTACLGALNTGDLAVFGWNSVGSNNTVSIVALNDIPAGTVVSFTDWGWMDVPNGGPGFNSGNTTGDGKVVWTVGTTVFAGNILTLKYNGAGAVTFHNVTANSDLSSDVAVTGDAVGDPMISTGDQFLIFQGNDNSPTFVFGFNNSASGTVGSDGWNTSIQLTSTDSLLPTGLTNGTNAIGFVTPHLQNVQYNGPTSTTNAAGWLARLTNSSNWTGDSASGLTTSAITLTNGNSISMGVPAPAVSGLSPTSGPTSGGTSVTITGSNFTGTTGAGGVKFGAINATSYVVNSDTQITAAAPAGSAGTVDVTVTNGSTSATSAADQYTYVAAPAVTSISPTAGPVTGGTSVVITGTNLSGTTAVSFGGTAATGFTVNSATQITATSPAHAAGTVDARVTTVGGTSATSAADQFTYIPAPTVTSISPTAGPTAGGTLVTITGTNFTGATAVTFGVTSASGITVNSATSITATSPAGTGTVDIRITTPGGTSATSAADQFTYVAAPTVTSISPTAGPTSGGTTVTITGTGFAAAPGTGAVKFGATNATYTINSNTQITATSPAGSAGTVDVTVTTVGGTSATSAADQYTYVPVPTVTSLSPTSGPTAGGTTVTITGTNFSGTTAVTFGATPATGFTVNSATQITATSPAGTGTVDVRITTVGGTSATSAADQFTYIPAPTVTSISPTAGPTAGGTTVTITGTNFTGVTAVTFGATAATGFTLNSATSITATSPAGTGTVDLRITTAGGTSATSAADQFTFVAAPTVTSVSPTAGPTTGGTTVIITGTNLSGSTAVSFGGTAATGFTVNSATQITATSPAHAAGTVDARVTTVGGTSATSAADQFTFVAAPTVTSLSPTSGPGAGGTTVTITGTNFSGATAVTFGATAATGFTVNSATQITATSPAGTGTVDVRVTTVGGTSATSAADQFTYIPAPTVTSISPTAGPTTGGTTVIITGTNLSGATAVSFGGTAATGFAVNSATQITATSPAGTGTVDLRITTASGTSATSAADQFTYVAAPTVTGISPPGGPLAGGTSVTLTGTGFTGATAVTFGATAATGITINSATQITATSPAGTGTVDVRVTTVGGTSATSAADQFTYIPAPTVASLSPTVGLTTGSTSVTLTGTGFTGATAVTFGATAANGFTVNSATQITATSPAGTGTVDVRVTNPGGTSATSAADQFTYVPPVVATQAVASVSLTQNHAATPFTPVTGSGGAPALSYGVAPTLPAGLSFDTSTGTISGTPTGISAATTYTVTITDTHSFSGSNSFSLTVNGPPTLSPATLPGGKPGIAYSQTVNVTSGTTPYSTMTVSNFNAGVSGLTLNDFTLGAGTATISFTPTAGGTATFTLSSTDANGAVATQNYTIAFNQPPVAVDDSAYVKTNEPVDIDVLANDTDPDQDTLTVFSVTQGLHGTVTIINGGTMVHYAPAGKFQPDTFTYTVDDGFGGQDTATVTVGDFISSSAGVYNGLVQAPVGVTPENARTGLIRLTVNRSSGKFTALLRLATTHMTITGAFDPTGPAKFGTTGTPTFAVKRKGLPDLQLALRLALDSPIAQLTGTLSDNGTPFAVLSADRALYTSTKNPKPPFVNVPAGMPRVYTVSFGARTAPNNGHPATDYPQGDGVGLLKIAPTGIATLTATLADGQTFSYANYLSPTNHWPFYVQLQSGAGSISGDVEFAVNAQLQSDAAGLNLNWFKPANPKSKVYPAGWSDGIQTDLLGSRFVIPVSSADTSIFPSLTAPDADGNAEVAFTDGGLPALGLTQAFNISTKNVAVAVPPNPAGVTLNARFFTQTGRGTAIGVNGSCMGAFLHPTTQKRVSYRAVIFQNKQAAFGFFLDDTESGSVTISPK